MISQTLRRVATELERFAKRDISVERGLDLLEASTFDLEEIMAINIMRESLVEHDQTTRLLGQDEAVFVPLFAEQETQSLYA
jgi:hypothetical protein